MNFFALLSDMPGEKVAKIRSVSEAVRDGMVVNLLLEAIPDLHPARTPTAPGHHSGRSSLRQIRQPDDHRNRIAFLEEPLQTATTCAPSPETGIAIARDEPCAKPDFAFAAEPGVRAVVIKPTLTGSPTRVREQVAAAHAAGLTAVISSSIESSLGLTQLARIAAWLTPTPFPVRYET